MRKIMKIRKWLSITAITVLIAILAVGCGLASSEKRNENEVSENAESPAVDLGEEEEIQVYNYANDSNYYWMEYDDESGFYGYKKDGSGETKYPVENFGGILLVTEDAVYYSRYRDKEGDVALLCQVPIKKGEDGTDVLELKEEIVLLEEPQGIIYNEEHAAPGIYADEDYIVYLTYEESEQVVRFNCKTKEVERYTPCKHQVTEIAYAEDGFLILVSMYGGFFRMDVASGEIVKLDVPDSVIDYAGWTWESYREQFIYAVEYEVVDSDDQLWMYYVQKDEKKMILDAKDLYQICGEQVWPEKGKQEITDFNFEDLFCQGNILYIQCMVRWETDGKEYCRYMIFSMDLSWETWEAKYEKEFTECMWEHCFEDYDDENEEYLNSGRCNAIVEGKAFLVLNEKGKAKQQVGCYNLEDGSFKILEKGMGEYAMPFFDSLVPYGYDGWELEEWLGAIC